MGELKIGRFSIPWSLVILCITLVAHGAVNLYRIDQIENMLINHMGIHSHRGMFGDSKVIRSDINNLKDKQLEHEQEHHAD